MTKEAIIKEFENIAGAENVMTGETDRHAYSYDAAVLDSVMPALVVRPQTSEALGAITKLCNDNGLPLTVRGAGTNLSGGTIPHPGGVVVLTNGLNRILEINEEDMYAVVEPGVVTAQFAAEVAKRGLFYPPDPGSQAVSTLGGNVAENAGGLRGLKYGVTKDYVMGMDFWDVNGELVKSGSRTVKCVTGYNLAGLMVASEGTLGVFDKIILKLVPPAQAAKSMMAVFPSMKAASETVASIIANKIVPATLEMMDNFTIRTVENFRGAGLPVDAAALLLIEVDGHPAQVEDEAAVVERICKENGATELKVAKDAAERDAVWQARRDALPALANLKPTCVLEDATVPRSKIPAMIEALEEIAKKLDLTIGTFGHAGDGNLHPTILTDKRDKAEWERVEKGIDMIFDKALSMGGTLSGEHGIGLAKSKYMAQETSKATLAYARRMKSVLDPKGILNPDKIIGAE
ncbi:FAD-linked oxidase C-terminal domain-containing protein [Pseudodesulfovibrio thermohalotolerans]|uniref:FAD-binding oxidoreductase n=1 Tax=Pseudodesulfovibrio thermohalotolerans TaxID=2880651 RepID=UPI0022B9DA9C|nr:FAD-linked oxidase C-terminal domain-containing protein [Pseudodesulfovibrio thermohalotolerans]WFS61425.1 FAD-linked oxidase C-terminal domain-containing protein [Pseudodesulfovibrio thermohalotolerans]